MSEKFKKQYGGSGEGGEWKTIKGTPVFIADGQTVEEAMEQTFRKKVDKPKNESMHKLSDSDKQIVEDAIYWLKKDGKAITFENVFKQLDEDMSGFRGNKQMDNAIKSYMNEKYSKTSVQKPKRIRYGKNSALRGLEGVEGKTLTLGELEYELESAENWVGSLFEAGGVEWEERSNGMLKGSITTPVPVGEEAGVIEFEYAIPKGQTPQETIDYLNSIDRDYSDLAGLDVVVTSMYEV